MTTISHKFLLRNKICVLVLSVGATMIAACGTAAGLPVSTNEPPAAPAPTPVNSPPLFDAAALPVASCLEGAVYQYQALATDPDGDVLTYALMVFPAGMTMPAGGLVAWIPAIGQAGSHPVSLSVSDGQSEALLGWTITVTAAPAATGAPAISSTPVTYATAGFPYGYQIIATGSPAPAISVSGNPGWLSLDAATGMLAGTPATTDAGSAYAIVVTASNGTQPDATQPFQLVVNAPGAPDITSPAVTDAAVGQLYSYTIIAAGAPAPAISVSGAPTWLSFDTATNTLSGTPPPLPFQIPFESSLNATTSLITVTASNGSLPDDSQQFTITVTNGWSTDSVAAAAEGAVVDVALDAKGDVHVAFDDALGQGLLYASNVSGAWQSQSVDPAAVSFERSVSIAIDVGGKAHVAYYDMADDRLEYATNVAGAWNIEVIDAGSLVGFYVSLVLDAQGKPHVIYYDDSSGALEYATNLSGAWISDVVTADPGSSDGAGFASLVVDAFGNPHVAYVHSVYGDLMYANRIAGPWLSHLVVDLGSTTAVWGNTAIGFDTAGEMHIAYSVYIGSLKYDVMRATLVGSSWQLEMIGTTPPPVQPRAPQMALTKDGGVHAYYLAELAVPAAQIVVPQAVVHLTNNAGVLRADIVDTTSHDKNNGDLRSPPAMALDAQGQAHIVYFHSASGTIKYATMP